ncbi:hypothetical protein CIB48_g6520 [Xylaria polymorpha]|nr:hypothetical protein CIB48_g6520 [Xylaria polymorpha]
MPERAADTGIFLSRRPNAADVSSGQSSTRARKSTKWGRGRGSAQMGNGGMGDGELDNAAVAGLECLICWSYGPFASRIGVIAKSDGPIDTGISEQMRLGTKYPNGLKIWLGATNGIKRLASSYQQKYFGGGLVIIQLWRTNYHPLPASDPIADVSVKKYKVGDAVGDVPRTHCSLKRIELEHTLEGQIAYPFPTVDRELLQVDECANFEMLGCSIMQ